MSKVHILKTWLPFWQSVESGAKTFEVRRNDRNFCVGDFLVMRAVDAAEPHHAILHEGKPRDLGFWVSYVLHGGQFGVDDGFVVLGLSRDAPARLDAEEPKP